MRTSSILRETALKDEKGFYLTSVILSKCVISISEIGAYHEEYCVCYKHNGDPVCEFFDSYGDALFFYNYITAQPVKEEILMESNVTKVVGKQVLDFVNKETGEKIVGVNLFINRPDENVDGLKSVKQFIAPSSSAYSQALALDFSKGSLDCVFNYSFQVGQKRPVLMSIDVIE